MWGTPYEDYYRLEDSKLKIRCLSRGVTEPIRSFGYPKTTDNYAAVIGRRQTDVNFVMETKMTFTAHENEEAGLIIMQANDHQYLLRKVCKDGKQMLQLVLNLSKFEGVPWMPGFTCEVSKQVLEEVEWTDDAVVLRMEAKGQDYTFSFGSDASHMTVMQHHGDGRLLNPEEVGPMAGTLLAMYATANGAQSQNEAAFDYFSLIKK